MPNKTVNIIINKRTLKGVSVLNCHALNANKLKEIPTTNPRKAKINTPRVGSEANACTDVITPERTRKVPNKLKEKHIIANKTVQLRRA